MSASGADWLTAVLKMILEEALKVQGREKEPVHAGNQGCSAHKYCVVRTASFAAPLLADADAVFTAHRDVRDVLLYHHAATPQADAFQALEREFSVYREWRSHACRDVRFEDVVSAGGAREARELLRALGLQRRVDLLSVVRKLGTWTRGTQQQAQQQEQKAAERSGGKPSLLSLLAESVSVHRLVFSGPMQAGTEALRRDMERVGKSFGGWLTEQGFEGLGSEASLAIAAPTARAATRCPRSAEPGAALRGAAMAAKFPVAAATGGIEPKAAQQASAPPAAGAAAKQHEEAVATAAPPPPLPPEADVPAPSACYEFSPKSSSVFFVRFGCFLKLDVNGQKRRVEADSKVGGRSFAYMSWGRKKYYGDRAWYGLASAALPKRYPGQFAGCYSAAAPELSVVGTCCPPPAWCPSSSDGEKWDDPPPEVTAA